MGLKRSFYIFFAQVFLLLLAAELGTGEEKREIFPLNDNGNTFKRVPDKLEKRAGLVAYALGFSPALTVAPTFLWSPWQLLQTLAVAGAVSGAAGAATTVAGVGGLAVGAAGAATGLAVAKKLPDVVHALKHDEELIHLLQKAKHQSKTGGSTAAHILSHTVGDVLYGVKAYKSRAKAFGSWGRPSKKGWSSWPSKKGWSGWSTRVVSKGWGWPKSGWSEWPASEQYPSYSTVKKGSYSSYSKKDWKSSPSVSYSSSSSSGSGWSPSWK